MELESIRIKNYRSIKEVVLKINEVAGKKCMILLGINESGKSNILKGINSKDDKGSIVYQQDCNQGAEDKKEVISIIYTKTTSGGWANILKNKGIPESLEKIIKIWQVCRIIFIDSYSRNDGFWVYINDSKEFSKYILINGEIQLKTDENQEINENEEITNLLNKKKLEKYLSDENFFSSFEHAMPKIIFWKAEDKYLINNKINLNEFKENTSISIPLRNCFNIADIKQSDIKNSIDSIAGNSAKKLRLQKRLSEKVTEYINTVWSEHKIKISFDIDDMGLSFLIEEKDDSGITIDVNQRSDGFKQFISILLNLSIENKTGILENKIILLDEPEIHLHPSGQKHLRDELLKIAENNIVIYATHSPYMVDKKNLDRHYHVEKDNGLTTIKKIEKNNPFGDEVLYKALGTSILEHVEPNVLIVEGKTDRDIFNLYCKTFKELDIPSISVISTDGADNFPKYAKFFNTKVIKGFALSDSDRKGDKAKKAVLNCEGYTKDNTFEINDFLDNKRANTLEDLFDKQHLENAMKHTHAVEIILYKTKSFIEQIKAKKRDTNEELLKKNFMQEIAKLSKEQLKKEIYYKFFEKLIKAINS